MDLSVYECVIISQAGEREFKKKDFVLSPDIMTAQEWFLQQIEEEFPNGRYEEINNKKGYWDESEEVFTYIGYVSQARGLVIPRVMGGATFMELQPLKGE